MNLNPKKCAILMIDMEKAFVEPGAALCIAGAKKTVPACQQAMEACRAAGAMVIWVKRIYAEDYSDMEIPRREMLLAKGLTKVLAPNSTGLHSIEEPEGLVPMSGDLTLIKPRYSAFFGTKLEQLLREKGIETVLLGGTTTPNCIRSTCYDGISYDFHVVVLEACCSSQTQEIQDANMEDMDRVGATIFRGTEFSSLWK